MPLHSCPDCGLVHFVEQDREPAEVTIARLNAESAYKIAALQARAEKHVAEVEAEASVDVAEAEAEAIVTALAPVEDAEAAEPEAAPVADPVLVIQDVDTAPEPEMAPPPAEHEEHHEAPRKSRGLGLW